MVKYVVVSGGVCSSIGKGVSASSIGLLMKSSGFNVTAIKIDPYLNVDAGTFSPYEHGETFVLDDGGECDLDLGNYERFMGITLTKDSNITTGKVYKKVIDAERKGDFLGKTVQIVPHITDAVQDQIQAVAARPMNGHIPDVCIIELGGTVGDIESMPFVEALRQLKFRVGHENFCLAHVSMVPTLSGGEQKTKPTQHTVRTLMSLGLKPDLLLCRCEKSLPDSVLKKLSMFTQIPESAVISVADVPNLYHVPLSLFRQGVAHTIFKTLHLSEEANIPSVTSTDGSATAPGAAPSSKRTMDVPSPFPEMLQKWEDMAIRRDELSNEVVIALVGKYLDLKDAYASVIKSLEHAAMAVDRKLVLKFVESEHLEESQKAQNPAAFEAAWESLKSAEGICVPGGFGYRGIEGKILAAQHARTNKVPYLGLCLGFQVAVIEFARHKLGWTGANSTEIDEKTPHPVIIYMPEVSRTHMGGTMRLGSKKTIFHDPSTSKLAALYGSDHATERHRHRYEVNTDFRALIEQGGLKFVGTDEKGERMEAVELDDHPYYVGVQYHPEFLSRPQCASPPFVGLLRAASGEDKKE